MDFVFPGKLDERRGIDQRACNAATKHAGMAEALIRLARDQDAQAVAGRAGSTAAGRLFDPERVVDAYERVYSALGTH